ncbi:MAG: triosephosphate isomerase, triosephosphate isomerase (TIM) [Candidatus Gottesmanbacteria bacterium GW2011_GWA2_43_14]|uniref:Triosephosphate isomerase n=1 Tax=Candidatus Gottesmanbacteria bacterium GW2011_GWA2_43_14 TaxID=1618443 RepID=A0A0G1FT79_9BACT|nr:MAG: triosephosphate isomerase, triosephosphate isomerase (TIM) [Candidatus Gottesmanbacteria bacterium GW2011_GWA2_43_14]
MVKKDLLIAGNWKCNKTKDQAADFFRVFSDKIKEADKPPNVEAVIFPSLIHLDLANELVKKLSLPIQLGAQNISAFPEGAFTGEVAAGQLKEVAQYVLIGHSERRINQKEDDRLLAEKAARAREAGLKIIYCVSQLSDNLADVADVIAYEPVWAIGTGKAATPEDAEEKARAIKNRQPKVKVLYGGSVSPENIRDFLKMPSVDGVLPGKTSLDPALFYSMLKNAAF